MDNSESIFGKLYFTGQNYSLELMFTKFATGKKGRNLKPLTLSSSGAICLKTTLEKCIIVERVLSEWDSNLRPPVYNIGYKYDIYH